MNNARRILPLAALLCAAGVLAAYVGVPRSAGSLPETVESGKAPAVVAGAPGDNPTSDWEVTGFGFSAPPKKSK